MNLELKDAGTARKIAIVTFDAEEIQNKENEVKKSEKLPVFPVSEKEKHLLLLFVKNIQRN